MKKSLWKEDHIDMKFLKEVLRVFKRFRPRWAPIKYATEYLKAKERGEIQVLAVGELEAVAQPDPAPEPTKASELDDDEDADDDDDIGEESEDEPEPAHDDAVEETAEEDTSNNPGSQQRWKEYDSFDHALEYLFGLETVMNMYSKGECADYGWFFPYSSAPGFWAISEFSDSNTGKDTLKAHRSGTPALCYCRCFPNADLCGLRSSPSSCNTFGPICVLFDDFTSCCREVYCSPRCRYASFF
jgi:hypothetical protein